MQIINVTIKIIWYFFLLFKEKVPIGKSTNMVLFPKEKVPYSTWYFFSLVLFSYTPTHKTTTNKTNTNKTTKTIQPETKPQQNYHKQNNHKKQHKKKTQTKQPEGTLANTCELPSPLLPRKY